MILNVAHRGARSVAPENTLVAAQKAYDLGAHMWETDIGVTKDDELIIFHNDSLIETTDAENQFPGRDPWTFTEFKLDEIKLLDAGSWFVKTDPHQEITAGNVSETDLKNYNGIEVPTVSEAIALTQKLNWKVNLELKKLPKSKKDFPVLERLFQLLDGMNFSKNQFVISSFNHDWLKEIKEKRPEYGVEALLGFPKPDVDSINWGNFEFEAYNVNRKFTTPAEIKEVTGKGYKIGLYNIDTKDDFVQFIDAGATRIITDYPQIMTKMGYCR